MTDELEGFLNDELGADAEDQEVNEEQEDAEPEQKTAEEEGAPAASEEETKEPEKTPEPEMVPISALMGKEAELRELKDKLANLQEAKPKEEIDPFNEPEKFKDSVISEAEEIRLNMRYETSEMIMRDKHDDFDDKAVKFEQLVKEDPSLYSKLVSSQNPAKFLYDHVVKTEKMKELDNIDDREAQIRAEERAKVMAELEAENKGKSKPDIPPSMVDVRSAEGGKKPTADNILDEIFPD